MARKVNEEYRKNKKDTILDAARAVFCRKGYLAVSMQDIIDECGISRGGIYLYFSSVDEIFQAAAERRSKEKFSVIRKSVDSGEAFEQVLNSYMQLQKERLLNMKGSLLRAMYEYIFSGAVGADVEFRKAQLEGLRRSVNTVLALGVRQSVLQDKHISCLADHFMIVIEGLSVLALTGLITEEVVDGQFVILNNLISEIRL